MNATRPCGSVSCPPDRDDAGYRGMVTEVGEDVHLNHAGQAYRWVTVRHPRGTSHVWPSNRLQG